MATTVLQNPPSTLSALEQLPPELLIQIFVDVYNVSYAGESHWRGYLHWLEVQNFAGTSRTLHGCFKAHTWQVFFRIASDLVPRGPGMVDLALRLGAVHLSYSLYGDGQDSTITKALLADKTRSNIIDTRYKDPEGPLTTRAFQVAEKLKIRDLIKPSMYRPILMWLVDLQSWDWILDIYAYDISLRWPYIFDLGGPRIPGDDGAKRAEVYRLHVECELFNSTMSCHQNWKRKDTQALVDKAEDVSARFRRLLGHLEDCHIPFAMISDRPGTYYHIAGDKTSLELARFIVIVYPTTGTENNTDVALHNNDWNTGSSASNFESGDTASDYGTTEGDDGSETDIPVVSDTDGEW